jgi:hypothetical protein
LGKAIFLIRQLKLTVIETDALSLASLLPLASAIPSLLPLASANGILIGNNSPGALAPEKESGAKAPLREDLISHSVS